MSDPTTIPARRDRWEFDRADRVGLAALLALVVTGAAVTWLVQPTLGWARGRDLEVPVFSKVQIPELARTGVDHGLATYALRIPDPTGWQRTLDLVPGLIFLLLTVVTCWQVFGVMGDIGRRNPFRPQNVRRLRVAAGALAFGWPIAAFAEATARFATVSQLDLGGFDPGPQLTVPWVPLVIGLVLALVAEAFKAGARLRDDVDGLV